MSPNSNDPIVSVLMPVHNGMPYLSKAVESVLAQTFLDFEFVIVNDCSTDGTTDYLNSLSDPRIRQIYLPANIGVAAALQTGLSACKGEFIARLDADDIAYPMRLKRQVEVMRQNPQVGLLGSFADTIAEDGTSLPAGKRILKGDVELRWDLLFKNPFIHSTVMFRSKFILDLALSYRLPHAEDYDLWTELGRVTELALLPEPLIQYRVNTKSWTYTKAKEQNLGGAFVSIREISRLVDASPDTIERIRNWVREGGKLPGNDLSVFFKLIRAFLKQHNRSVTFDFIERLRHLIRKRLGWGVVKEPMYWLLLARQHPIRVM